MSKSRMQNLILEVLNAQPSLRDSKQYLNSFGPKNSAAKGQGSPPLATRTPTSSYPTPAPHGNSSLRPGRITSQGGLPFQPPPLPHPHADALALKDSHSHPDSQIASTSKVKIGDAVEADKAKTETGPDSQVFMESSSLSAQQHTALVKIQGPFTRRQLESIADGMVYLKKLGLVSVIVVDGDGWSQAGVTADFSADGSVKDVADEKEDLEMAPWTTDAVMQAKRARKRELTRKRQISLRRTMQQDVQTLSDLLQDRGAPARPFFNPLLRVDADAAREAERLAPRHFPGVGAEATSSAQVMQSGGVAGTGTDTAQSSALSYQQMRACPERSPLVSDDVLSSLRAALATDHIPVIAPLALYADPSQKGAERSIPVRADDVLTALARDMSIAGKEEEEAALRGDTAASGVDMMPLRLMVINREGGPPSHARGGNPHLAINLASEFAHIRKSFIWDHSHPTALSNLHMIHDCLSYMPHTSSGIIVSHRSPRSLIANLLTNKAAHSPSLPFALLASRQDVKHTPTIVRPGLGLRVIQDFANVDRAKLTALLEASFRRKLDSEGYYRRLEQSCDFVIVIGDYQGAAIVTRERAPDDGPDEEPISYLDKFAVLPQLQGSGTVDFLWGALRDEVHGLGLLDALNDNGGKGGFGSGRDLVWKSRADNPVNKWYFERSNGFVKVDTTPAALRPKPSEAAGSEPKKDWMLFWCDAEERLSKMSGERRLGASASPEDVWNSIDDQTSAAEANFYDGEDDDFHGGRNSRRLPPRSSKQRSPFERKLAQLDPRPGGAGQRLLPVIAPDESGRLERWAKCMCHIPSAWL
ncbi:unnamed protein product [Parajaminaea phylloscopi]